MKDKRLLKKGNKWQRIFYASILALVAVTMVMGIIVPQGLIRNKAESLSSRKFSQVLEPVTIQKRDFSDDYENYIQRIDTVVSIWDFYNKDLPEHNITDVITKRGPSADGEEANSTADKYNDINTIVKFFPVLRSFGDYMRESKSVYITEEFTPKPQELLNVQYADADMLSLRRYRSSFCDKTINCYMWVDPLSDALVYMTLEIKPFDLKRMILEDHADVANFNTDAVNISLGNPAEVISMLDSIAQMNNIDIEIFESDVSAEGAEYEITTVQKIDLQDGYERVTNSSVATAHVDSKDGKFTVFYRHTISLDSLNSTVELGITNNFPK